MNGKPADCISVVSNENQKEILTGRGAEEDD